MMDPAVKTAMAVCVLLGGVCAAMLFRHKPAPGPISPSAEEQFLLRCSTQPAVSSYDAVTPVQLERPNAAARRRPATVVAALDRHEPPPSLAPGYPEPKPQEAWMETSPAASADDEPRTHRVVDGDTLAALAQRYLGSADRAQEIYDANRDVLRDPMLLPIDIELKIPPRGHPTSSGLLVPVSAGNP
jgi:nucleoid-associated protein YgaU